MKDIHAALVAITYLIVIVIELSAIPRLSPARVCLQFNDDFERLTQRARPDLPHTYWSCILLMADNDDYSMLGNAYQPPPASSILATHLVPHLAQGHETHLIPRETFAQLRQELLGERQSQVRVDEGITDINKLVCIVLKAGLDASPDSSGAPENDLEGQVQDCLDIIQTSLEKAPQALWDISDPLILGEELQVPLFVWLVIRLIKLATIWTSDTVHKRIHDILCSLVFFQSKQTRSSSAYNSISAFGYACISG